MVNQLVCGWVRGVLCCGVVVMLVCSGFVVVQADEGVSSVVLLTGFEPFFTYEVNPSELIVEALNGLVIDNVTVYSVVLPVNFSSSFVAIKAAIAEVEPVAILSLGLNAGARGFQVENIGFNLRKRPRSDLLWFLPNRLDVDGCLVQVCTVDTGAVVAALRDEGFLVRQSFYAGLFVCNSVLYNTLNFLDENNVDVPMGFMHVPPLPDQEPYGVPLDMSIEAVRIAVGTIVG